MGKQAGSSATCRGGTGTGNPSLVMTYAFGITTALFKEIYISFTMFLPHHLRLPVSFFSISLVHVGFLGWKGFEGCTIVMVTIHLEMNSDMDANIGIAVLGMFR